MKYQLYIDSISIIITNISQYSDEFFKFYEDNNLEIKSNSEIIKKNNSNEDQFKNIVWEYYYIMSNSKSLMKSMHSGNQYNEDKHTTFTFAGIKSYSKKLDERKENLLENFLEFIIINEIPYKLNSIDFAYDFKISSIKHLFVSRDSFAALNNPHNYHKETTLYIEDRSTKNSSLKAYIYNKTIKEHLKIPIVRFEISIRKLDNIFEENFVKNKVDYIVNKISKYRLFYFEDIKKCDDVKHRYKTFIINQKKLEPKRRKLKIPEPIIKMIKKTNGKEIDLSLDQYTIRLLKMIYKDSIVKYKDMSINKYTA